VNSAPSVPSVLNNRLIVTKAALWFLVGIACVVAVVRFVKGLGATTALTDTTPWGMWIGFDVMAGVALAGGGFVIAATVYIFGQHKYHEVARPAILTAFLGYLAVIVGLLVDLGRPRNIIQVIFNHNLHSPLFEVAMCVMFYTAVLALEFAPVGLERFAWAQPAVRLLRKLTLPLVIIGIALSTLHQSSLGTLFLLSETRMHPLWYSPLLPPMFLISAVGLGLGMVCLESLISSWLYRREREWELLTGLTRAAAVVLGVYLILRLGDLAVRGQLGYAFDGSWFATLFWVELSLSAIAPGLLFSLPGTRGRSWAISWGAFMVVAGFILHRADVGGISHMAVTGEIYVPALSELAISVGIVAGMGLIFLFFVENLRVWETQPEKSDRFTTLAVDPFSSQFIGAPWFGSGQRAVLAWIFGVVAGIGIMELQLAAREQAQASPVRSARSVMVTRTPREGEPGNTYRLAADDGEYPLAANQVQNALLIDSGGAGRFFLFGHESHQHRLGGQASCGSCHHRNLPLDRGTSCTYCHRDMYRTTDTFDHQRHEVALDGKASCAGCHTDPAAAKDRQSTKTCDSCHQPVQSSITTVRNSREHEPGQAPGYQEALHGLCITCHREHEQTQGIETPYLSQCSACHRGNFADENELRRSAGWRPMTALVKP